MADFSLDPVHNVIQLGIKDDIEFTLQHGRWRAATTLIYQAIDIMGSLAMPSNAPKQEKRHFIEWADKYIRFAGAEQLSGVELYAARCGYLHSYSIDSEMSRSGKCRRIGYIAEDVLPEVVFVRSVDMNMVLVTIVALKRALFSGIDRFLADSFSDMVKGKLVEDRLKEYVHVMTLKRDPVTLNYIPPQTK